ncbi:MAG: metal ABC transporter permease [Thermoplasmatota archaeon]
MIEIEMLEYAFMRNAIYAGVLASIVFGIIGTYVVVKRIVSISGGIAHSSFGGVGLALYMGFEPLLGASIFALVSALGIGMASEKKVQRKDTTIGIVWSVGMALGAFFMYITPGYQTSPANFLFGNMLMIRIIDIYLLLGLAVVILISVFLLFHKLQAVSFDKEFSEVVGVETTWISLFLLVLVAFSVVFLIKFVGIILVIAMLAIPASISSQFTHDLRKIMGYSTGLSLFFVLSGLWLSWEWNLQAGPTIVLTAGVVFLLMMFYSTLKRWF